MSLARLRLVSFDVTNTLIRVKGSPGQQYSLAAKKFGIDVDEKVLTSVWVKKYKEFCTKYPNFGCAVNMPASAWWGSLVKECFQSVDSQLQDEVLDKVADSLYFHFSTEEAWDLMPGAVLALRDLRRYDVKTAIISNWDHRLYRVLHSLKLRDCFDFVLPSYIMGVEKPEPAIFLQALQDVQCKPQEAVHFGDNIEKDFIGARNVGMDSYLLQTRGMTSDFLDQKFVVSDAQSFVNAIRSRLGPLRVS